MTAQEMFEELGYKKNKSECYTKTHILYEKCKNNDIYTIEFKHGSFVYTTTLRIALKTNYVVLKAINKQMEELGWI